MCACVRERHREKECVEYVCVSVCESCQHDVCVCVRERESVCERVCVCDSVCAFVCV